MAISIQNIKARPRGGKVAYFTIEYDGKDYKWHGCVPDYNDDEEVDPQDYLDGRSDIIKAEILRNQYPEAVVPRLNGRGTDLESFEAWVSAGAKNAEVKQEIPAIKAKAAVYEDVEVEPAVEAKDAVMGERHKESSKEVDKSEVQVVKEGDKYVQKTVVSKKVVKEPVYEEVPLYGEDGEKVKKLVSEAVEAAPSVKYEEGDELPEGKKVGMVKTPAVKAKAAVYEDVKHSIPVMEEYEEEPAVKAKAAVTERRLVSEAVKAVAKKELIIKPEAVIEKKAWVNSH